MTIHHDTEAVRAGTTGDGRSTSEGVAESTVAAASDVASTTVDGARQVGGEASAQARAVAGEAKQQLSGLVDQGRRELRAQAEQRGTQAGGQLRTLSERVGALAAGDPEGAGPLPDYLHDAEAQVRKLADRLDAEGPQGIVDDVARFARRRPGLFLAGAMGAGLLVGRMIRAEAANREDDVASGRPDTSTTTPVSGSRTSTAEAIHTGDTIAAAQGDLSGTVPDPGMLP